jgi:lysyl-tRNA synthetase class 2
MARELEVEFRSGEIYRYGGVPPHSYSDLLAAPSKGGYFNSSIRNRFPFKELSRHLSVQTDAV